MHCIGGLVRPGSPFGLGSGPIVLDDVRCNGNEAELLSCRSNGPLNHNCNHHDDVSITCVEGELMVETRERLLDL